jgi:hypothetical protein
MNIRLADFSTDGQAILDGAWDFIRRMGNPAWVPVCRDDFEQHLLHLLKNPAFEILIAEHDGEIVAGIGVCRCSFMWNPDYTAVEEIFWWASPAAPPHAAISVLRHAIDWAREEASPREVLFSMKRMDTSPDGVGRLYERLGLTHMEVSHMGVI